jgi:hypothetical protein
MTFNTNIFRATTSLLGLVILLHAGLAQADDMDYLLHTTPTERAASQTHFMQSQLGLTTETTAQVQLINQKYAEKVEPVIKGSSNRISKMLDMKEIQEQKEAELQKVLTATQFEAYQNAKDALKAAMQHDLQH